MTSEEMERLVEQVGRLRMAMADVRKRATNEDLQRMEKMEGALKKLEEETRTRQEVTMRLNVEVGRKATREGRGCAGLVQGVDETRKLNEASGRGKGKGNKETGDHGRKGDNGGKGFQQTVKMLKGEEEQEADEEDERVQVPPNMGLAQAMTDPREEGWKRKVMWLDCSDEEQEGQEGEAGGRGERCEVWKERVSGRGEMWSEESEERLRRELRRERGESQERAREEREEGRGAERGADREEQRGAERRRDEKPPGFEDVESEQEAREEEQRRAPEAREERERRRELRRSELSKREREVEAQGGQETEAKAQGRHDSETMAHEW